MSDKLYSFSSFQRPTTLIIECDNIYLHQKSIDLTIEIPTEKIEQFETLTVNGVKFVKYRSE